MRITKSIILILILSLLMVSAPAMAVGPIEPLVPPPATGTDEMINETPAFWFVELSSPPAADGTSLAALRAEKRAFRANARAAGLVYTERYAFDTLWNGLSIQIAPSELAKLARIPGVKNIFPVETIAIPEPEEGFAAELATALNMTGANIAQSELGLNGTGIKVGIIDTGIDYHHPDLGGGFGPGFRVFTGWDFVGDAFNGTNMPVPDPDPDDCHGHGTHVAGIVGASGGITGVAPGVTFGAYRVFGCTGSTTSDIIIAALERALADGMDIINMSLGAAFQWPQHPTAMASNRLVNEGVVVVASIGNNQPQGLYATGSPGLGRDVIGVASYDNTHMFLPYFEVSGTPIGYITMAFSPPAPLSGTFEIVPAAITGLPLPGRPLGGRVALVRRGGGIGFRDKAINAIANGAVAVVIDNNVPGPFSGSVGSPLPIPRPVVGISQADGDFIRAQAAPVSMTWTDKSGSFPIPTGGLISAFSSFGLAPDLAIKPDIGAPGGFIRSTVPVEMGSYGTMSGTSMSAPHVAGAVALLLQAKPDTDAEEVRGILQNSADPTLWSRNPATGFLDNVHLQGAGMLDIDDAILSTTKVSPAKIATGESQAGRFTQRLTIENDAATAVTYNLSFVNALSTGNDTFVPTFWTSDALVTFRSPTVTVPAGRVAVVIATITPATGPTGGIYGGYIVLTPQGGGRVYRVPFAGFIGDYQSIVAMAPGAFPAPGLPRLGWTTDGVSFGFAAPNRTFNMTGFDVPYFMVHFAHQARSFRVNIFGGDGTPWGQTRDIEYLPRNAARTGFFAFPFDGMTLLGRGGLRPVPDGTYYAIIRVLKANGDARNPAHWETWTSPLFIIDRP